MITTTIATLPPDVEHTANVLDPLTHAQSRTNPAHLQIVAHAALRLLPSLLMAIQEIAMHEIKGW